MTTEQKRKREFYNFNKEHGICANCAQTWAEPGHVYCRACAKKKRWATKKRDPTGEIAVARKAGIRAYRKANGLCYDCGKPTGGGCRCPTCAKKNVEAWTRWNIRKKIKQEAEEARRNR